MGIRGGDLHRSQKYILGGPIFGGPGPPSKVGGPKYLGGPKIFGGTLDPLANHVLMTHYDKYCCISMNCLLFKPSLSVFTEKWLNPIILAESG